MRNIFVQTYGCQMNEADSAEMLLHLTALGCTECAVLSQADIVLVNTCTVRDHAEHKALSFLGRLRAWKRKNPARKIIFAGCAAQRLGRALKAQYPYVDLIFGAKNIDDFQEVLEQSAVLDGAADTSAAQNAVPAERAKTSPLALVNIMRGCSCRCSYCIVPFVRGEARSISPDVIYEQVRQKVARGAAEITLLGQTVNAYNYKGKSFVSLINDIAKIDGVKRLRFLSPHPAFINEDFAKAVADNKNIARHLHLPVQSGSDAVLRAMKRGYTRRDFLAKASLLKSVGMALSTDIIVGYPTETEEDFLQTISLVEEANFNGAYCFKFSPRAMTAAAALEPLAREVVERRLNILLNKVKGLAALNYQAQIGARHQVLMETPHSGRTATNLWVKTQGAYAVGGLEELEIKAVEKSILIA